MAKHEWLGNLAWWRMAERMVKLTVIPPDNYSSYDVGAEYLTERPSEAKLLSSRVSETTGDEGLHIIALDLDMPAALVPSSTEGHFHLYIDHELGWPAYEKLLDALADAGVIERGYAEVSKARKETHLRTPWTRKQVIPEQPAPQGNP